MLFAQHLLKELKKVLITEFLEYRLMPPNNNKITVQFWKYSKTFSNNITCPILSLYLNTLTGFSGVRISQA